ncbi:hypothetical protein JTE90_018321 [Oedothorax gibbosus]|uniref:Transposase n=1 Tax=Oedothorax gibbosus TaxID=931172 RepID=A0AAV6U287_9ARAC|nr:hypothetical protein JTE90_018321 [Oedothorax gibbosus]
MKYSDFILSPIRRIVHQFFKKNKIPTAKRIFDEYRKAEVDNNVQLNVEVNTDETWAKFGHTKSSVWQDNLCCTQTSLSIWTVDWIKSSNRKRIPNYHHSCRQCRRVRSPSTTRLRFKAKKHSGDYHNEMTGDHYEDWFTTKFLQNLEASVIVIDNAPYHERHARNYSYHMHKKGRNSGMAVVKGHHIEFKYAEG